MNTQEHLDAAAADLTSASAEQLTDHQRTNLLLSSIAHTLLAQVTEKKRQQARLLA